jgi:hypothetical protein
MKIVWWLIKSLCLMTQLQGSGLRENEIHDTPGVKNEEENVKKR